MFRPKQPDQRVISLAMWAAGVDQASQVPAQDQMLAFNTNFQSLRSLFWAQGNQGSTLGFLTRRWYLSQGGTTGIVTATAKAEIAGTMQPTMAGRTKADFTVDLLLPDPYFYQLAPVVRIDAPGTAAVANLGDGAVGFGQAAGSGGVSFTIKLTGPLTSPVTLTNNTNGVSVTLNVPATLTAGHFVVLDVMNYTANTDTGTSYLSYVTHTGARPWMVLLPAGPNASLLNQLSLQSGNNADAGYADITFSYPYL